MAYWSGEGLYGISAVDLVSWYWLRAEGREREKERASERANERERERERETAKEIGGEREERDGEGMIREEMAR